MREDRLMEVIAAAKEKVTELYDIYAEEFPEKADFWMRAAGDEKKHAAIIRELGKMARNKEIGFDGKTVSERDVRELEKTIESEKKKAESAPITYKQALAAAAAIQKNVVEFEIFDAYSASTGNMSDVIISLKCEMQKHMQNIINEIRISG
jgi:rubrerythrin